MGDNIAVFKKWMLYQLRDRQLSVRCNEKGFFFDHGSQHGEILFYGDQLIEEKLIEKDETTFYLYYRFIDYAHGCQMFQAMMQALHHNEPILRVMICCSGGLTSAFFVSKMKRYIALNKIPMKMMAGAVSEIDDMRAHTDLIMVAPQMRYAIHQIQKKADGIPVIAIKPAVFAAYDCHGLYLQIQETINDASFRDDIEKAATEA